MPEVTPTHQPENICGKCGKIENTSFYMCRVHKREYHKNWRSKQLGRLANLKRQQYQQCKKEVIEHYTSGTNKCACCGESTYGFLTIDHIKGNGTEHSKVVRSRLALWLRRNKYPKGFQILCYNCNCGKGLNKNICPHKQKNTVKKS